MQIELHKSSEFLNKNFKIKEIINKLNITHPTLIFGSYAKETQKKDSDLDMLIVGEYNKNIVKKTSKFFDLEINVKSITSEDLIKAIKNKEILINEIIKDHIIINGFEFFTNAFLDQ